MPFEIIRNDISKMAVDAIVNTANPQPVVGVGTDATIHKAAGPRLLEARQKIGPIAVGHAAVTPAYGLRAQYVIHTVGPVWLGGSNNEEDLLRQCYDNALKLAVKRGCKSIAFPLISTGTYGFPKDKALQIAIAAFSAFLTEQELQIYLVVFDRSSFRLSEQLFRSVASYIEENYVDRHCISAPLDDRQRRVFHRRAAVCKSAPLPEDESALPAQCGRSAPPQISPKTMSLQQMLEQEDAGFSETLLTLIDQTGKKDSEIYKKANLSKQHFSKIRNNPHYKPTKPTAVALALALELDLSGTRDLIGRAGYALTNSSKFDLIIRYFIEQGNYNVVQINVALYEFDQPLLGFS